MGELLKAVVTQREELLQEIKKQERENAVLQRRTQMLYQETLEQQRELEVLAQVRATLGDEELYTSEQLRAQLAQA